MDVAGDEPTTQRERGRPRLRAGPRRTQVARMEVALFRLVTVALAVIVLAQAYLQYDDLRVFFNYTDRVEVLEVLGYPGRDLAQEPALRMRLLLLSQPQAPDVQLLVNGRKAAGFTDGQVVLQLNRGDRLAIDARQHDELLRYRVVQTSPEVVAPPEGWEFETLGTLEALGTVQTQGDPGDE